MQRGLARVIASAVVAVAAVSVTASCSSSASSKAATGIQTGDGPTNSSTTSTDNACARFTQADAARLFGRAAEKRVVAPPPGIATCTWGARAAAGTSDDVSYLLRVSIFPSAASYGESDIPGAKPLRGLGDKAFTSLQNGTAQVQYVKGRKTYDFKYTASAPDGTSPASAALLAKLIPAVRANAAQG